MQERKIPSSSREMGAMRSDIWVLLGKNSLDKYTTFCCARERTMREMRKSKHICFIS